MFVLMGCTRQKWLFNAQQSFHEKWIPLAMQLSATYTMQKESSSRLNSIVPNLWDPTQCNDSMKFF